MLGFRCDWLKIGVTDFLANLRLNALFLAVKKSSGTLAESNAQYHFPNKVNEIIGDFESI